MCNSALGCIGTEGWEPGELGLQLWPAQESGPEGKGNPKLEKMFSARIIFKT